jgi:hypothetical protein
MHEDDPNDAKLLSLLKRYDFSSLGGLARQPAFPPTIVVATKKPAIQIARDYSVTFGSATYGNVVAGTANLTVRFGNVPSTVYALVGWARDEANPLTITDANALSCFQVQLTRDEDQRIQVNMTDAANVLGTAARPRYLGGNAIPLIGNDTWQVDIVANRAGTTYTVGFWVVESRPVEAFLN